jgi:hypothetical protein
MSDMTVGVIFVGFFILLFIGAPAWFVRRRTRRLDAVADIRSEERAK